jgi:hypothetical protein
MPSKRLPTWILPLYIERLSGAAEKSYLLPTYPALRAASGRAKYVPATYLHRRAARPPAARNTYSLPTYLSASDRAKHLPTYLPTQLLPTCLAYPPAGYIHVADATPFNSRARVGGMPRAYAYVAQWAFSRLFVRTVTPRSNVEAITLKKLRLGAGPASKPDPSNRSAARARLPRRMTLHVIDGAAYICA